MVNASMKLGQKGGVKNPTATETYDVVTDTTWYLDTYSRNLLSVWVTASLISS